MAYSQLQILNDYILAQTQIEVEPSRYYFLFNLFEQKVVTHAIRLLQNIPENRRFIAPKKMFIPIELAHVRPNGVINSKIPNFNFGSVLEVYKKEILKQPNVKLTREEICTHIVPALYHIQRVQGVIHPGLVSYLNYETFMSKL